MNTELAVDETPRIWAALIEQSGQLLIVAAQFIVAQHLYSTYLANEPNKSWLLQAWHRYVEWNKRRDVKRWLNDPREVELIGS